MIKWLLLCLPLMAFGAIHQTHDDAKKTDEEFRNYELGLQPRQMKVFNATPTLNDVQDREMVIVASNTWVTQMFRWNDDLWKVNASCSTIFR